MIVKFFSLVFVCFLTFCSDLQKASKKPNYQELCKKINQCFYHLSRTLPKSLQVEITDENCVKKIQSNLSLAFQKNIKKELFQQNFYKCNTAILNSPCHDLIKTSYFSPFCIKVRNDLD